MTTNDNNANLGALISVVHKQGLYLVEVQNIQRVSAWRVTHMNINTSIYKVFHEGFSTTATFLPRCVEMDIVWMGVWKIPLPCTVWSVASGAPGLVQWDVCMCQSLPPSEGLVVPRGVVSSGGWGAGRALVCALGAGAQVLLFRASAGGDRGGRGGGRAGLLLKVCDDDSHVAHRYSQLLSRAPVHILQFWSEM